MEKILCLLCVICVIITSILLFDSHSINVEGRHHISKKTNSKIVSYAPITIEGCVNEPLPSPSLSPAASPSNVAPSESPDLSPDYIFDVMEYGAVGDGSTDDTEAFIETCKDACQVESVVLLAPVDRTFMITTTIFSDPWKPGLEFQGPNGFTLTGPCDSPTDNKASERSSKGNSTINGALIVEDDQNNSKKTKKAEHGSNQPKKKFKGKSSTMAILAISPQIIMPQIKSTPSHGGKKYFINSIDDCTRYCYVYLLNSKDEAIDAFRQYKTKAENLLDKKIKMIRSDRGEEYESPFAQICVENGIIHQTTAPYSPQSNGIAERENRTLKEMMNVILISFGLPQNLWGEAILTP
ncbi:Polygalacturonase [Capsicum chinense]|nr:Polygalacturonase [Capsicum chinense]